MTEKTKTDEPMHYVLKPEPGKLVLKAEPGKFEVSVGLVTAVSTTANSSFDKFVGVFTKRISDKAAEIFGEPTQLPESDPERK